MAGIDYNILGQIKPFQLESPMNAMAQAMQLRGLQEASQMNALKAQEYQQQVQEKNALARLMGSGIPYGSDEFFNRLSVEAPSYVEPIASGVEKRRSAQAQQELALSTKQKREQEKEEAERKFKEARRGNAFRYIANAQDFKQAASLVERSVRNGDISREEADDMLAPLYASGQPDMGQFRANVLTGLLPAKEALTAGYDVEKAALDVDKAKQDFAKAKFGFTTEQIDTRRKQFDQIYPTISISSEADVEARIRAQAEDPVLGPLIKQFGSVEQLIARDKNEFRNNAPGYKARLSGVPTADILKAVEERDNEAYRIYRLNEIYAGRQPLDKESFLKNRNALQTTAPAPAAVSATATTSEAPAAVTTAADGTRVMPNVTVAGQTEGFDYLDPTAKRLLQLAAETKDSTEATGLRETAGKIQTAFEKDLEEQRKGKRLTGDFLNVTIAEDLIAELEKNPNPVNLKKIANLRAQIKAANEGKAPKNYNVIKMPPGPKAVDEKYAQDYLDWTQGGGADAAANSAQIKMVLDRFANGEILSGPSIGLAPDFFNALVNPEALGAKQAVQEVVQRNLRAVLGAQFTQVEGENLVNRAFDPRLKPQENAKRLRKLFLQMQTAANQKQAMAEYYEANETLRGFKGKQPKMQDFFNVLTAPDAPPKGSVDVMVDGKMHRFKSQADLEAYKAKGGKVDK
jgi:hypothetical protein